MTTTMTEQAVVTLTVTRADGSTYTTRVTDSEIATDPLAHAAAAASSLVRLRPEVTSPSPPTTPHGTSTPADGTRSGSLGRSRAPARRPTG